MKIARVPDLGIWVTAEYADGEDKLPTLTVFQTRDQAREAAKGNPPSVLSKVKLFFEGIL